jgi:hypothetical protein
VPHLLWRRLLSENLATRPKINRPRQARLKAMGTKIRHIAIFPASITRNHTSLAVISELLAHVMSTGSLAIVMFPAIQN